MRYLYRGLLFGIMSMLAVMGATVWPSVASAEPIVQAYHLPSDDIPDIVILGVVPFEQRLSRIDGESRGLEQHAAIGPVAPDYALSERTNGQNFLRPHRLC